MSAQLTGTNRDSLSANSYQPVWHCRTQALHILCQVAFSIVQHCVPHYWQLCKVHASKFDCQEAMDPLPEVCWPTPGRACPHANLSYNCHNRT